MSSIVDAMARYFGGNKTPADFVEPRKPRIQMRGCTRPTCPGVCPLKVVVQKHGTAKPALCRVCERKFTIPPGAEKLFPAKTTTPKGHTPQKQELDKLRNQVSQLKEQLHKHKGKEEDSGEKEGDEPPVKPSLKVSNLEKCIRACKEVGASTVDLEKQLAEAKKLLDKPGDPCKAILGKLNHAIKREEQLQNQLAIDFKKLEATQAKLQEASVTVLSIQNEKDLLFKQYGHDKQDKGPAQAFTPPEELSGDDVQRWNDMCSEQFTILYNKLKENFTATFPVSNDEEQEDEGAEEPKQKSQKKGTPPNKPAAQPLGPEAPLALAAEANGKELVMDIDSKGGGTKRTSDALDEPKSAASASSSSNTGGGEAELTLKFKEMASKKLALSMQKLQLEAANAVVDEKESDSEL